MTAQGIVLCLIILLSVSWFLVPRKPVTGRRVALVVARTEIGGQILEAVTLSFMQHPCLESPLEHPPGNIRKNRPHESRCFVDRALAHASFNAC
jgi:hypothetical protein